MPSTLPPLKFAGDRSRAAWQEMEAQGRIAPGTEGWWEVWGASVRDVQAGDLVLAQSGVDEQEAMLVDDTFTAKADPIRRGFVVEGERVTMGVLCKIVLLRRGTHHTLAESVR
jgi:hypothetical protein